jgi:energy-coupling factor transporter ATP-binding protein EcfA2
MQDATVIFNDGEDLSDGDLDRVSKSLIQEVSTWKLEAKAEDNDRYFFHVREVEAIENGERCYVIGRKGSGKTAISEYFSRLGDHNTFAEKLTFKNFPFNELYALKNEGYTRPNEYITLWKYLIYSSICKLMAGNENIEGEIKAKLEKLYGTDHAA